jgi:hypothetical protein
VAIVANDAGGAEILSAFVAQYPAKYLYSLGGPARNIFQRRLGDLPTLDIDESVAVADWVLTGTGWSTDFEWSAIRRCQESGVPSVAFLDHWVNYRERFVRDGTTVMPTEIWVGDEYAERIAEEVFHGVTVRRVENPYLKEVERSIRCAELENIDSGRINQLLVLSENISDHAKVHPQGVAYWGYDEFDAIEYLIQNLNLIHSRPGRVVIRPHPADAAGKYDSLVDSISGIEVVVDSRSTLVHQIARSVAVAGCETMAMVVALAAGREVYEIIPPGGRASSLPHEGITRLADLRG